MLTRIYWAVLRVDLPTALMCFPTSGQLHSVRYVSVSKYQSTVIVE